VEEALVEMYLAGVSVRRVEGITEALWGTRVSPSTVSELNQKIYVKIETWCNRPIEGNHPHVFLDGWWLKRSWGGEVRNVSLLVAIGVNEEGFREVLAVAEGSKEDNASWTAVLRHLKERGLKGVRLFVSDKCLGLVDYMRLQRVRTREMFVALVHAPGETQADFGEALVVVAGVECKAHYFATDLPQSDDCCV
jgi:transposase-like protein